MLVIARSSFKLFFSIENAALMILFFVLTQDILVTPVLCQAGQVWVCTSKKRRRAPAPLLWIRDRLGATHQNPSSCFTIKPPRAPSQRFLQRVQAGKDEFRAGMFSKDSPSWLWEVFLRTRGVTTLPYGATHLPWEPETALLCLCLRVTA